MRFMLGRCCCNGGGGGGPVEPCCVCPACTSAVPCQFQATIVNTSTGSTCGDFNPDYCDIAGTYLLDCHDYGQAGELIEGGTWDGLWTYSWCRWLYVFPSPSGCSPQSVSFDIDVYRPPLLDVHTVTYTLAVNWLTVGTLSWRVKIEGGTDPNCTAISLPSMPINETIDWPWDPFIDYYCEAFTEEPASVVAVPIPP